MKELENSSSNKKRSSRRSTEVHNGLMPQQDKMVFFRAKTFKEVSDVTE